MRSALSATSLATAPEAAASARLELRSLRKTLGDTAAVNGIDLVVAPGESVVLLGPSGCGKTTTLRMVAGFIQPDGGEIHLDGTLASNAGFMLPPERRHLGMVFQTYAIWPHKTVADNVAYGLHVAGRRRAEVKTEVASVLDLVQLRALTDRFPAELSGGQQQRVALARALATKPSLLLLDEPLSNLDAALREEMRYELRALQRELGITMLYVTHDQDEALVLADRIVVMNKGRIEQVAPPEEVYRTPASRFVASFVGIANLFEGTVDAVDRPGGRVRVALDVGSRLWSRAPARWLADVAVGSQATVLVRPEDVRLEAPEGTDQDEGIPARFEADAFLGSHYELKLAAGAMPVRVRARKRGRFTDGQARIWARPGSAWVVA